MNVWVSAVRLPYNIGKAESGDVESGDVMFRLMADNTWRMYVRTAYGTWKNRYFPKSWFLA